MTTHAVTATLTPRQPFAWQTILASLRSSPGTVLERVDGTTYQRAVRADGQPAVLSVTAQPSDGAPLSITCTTPQSPHATVTSEWLARTVAHIFQTDVDLTPLDALDDAPFATVWAPCRGFRPVQLPTVWEAIAWAIIGQQINVAFAARCKAAFCQVHGDRVQTSSGDLTLFPTPEVTAGLDESALQALQFSRQKARYVIGVARAISEGRFDTDALHSLPPEEALTRLMSLTGVGRWTAEYVLLRGLGYPDALPAGDVALQRAVGRAYGLDRLATEAEVRAYGERWAPFRSYATIAFWRSNAQARPRAATAP